MNSNDPDLTQDIDRLNETSLMIGYHARRMIENELAHFGLTSAQFALLKCLKRCRDHTTVTALAEHTHQVPPTVTNMLNRLEERGLVLRQRDPDDRRNQHVSLTPAGEDIIQQFTSYKREQVAQFLQTMSREERKTLLTLLQRYLDSLITDSSLSVEENSYAEQIKQP